jgi:hypothetical protein
VLTHEFMNTLNIAKRQAIDPAMAVFRLVRSLSNVCDL